jgi:hypothetical protein
MSMTDAALNNMASWQHEKVLALVEDLAADRANRTPLLTLLKMATTPERAQMLFDAIQEQDFLDPRGEQEPEDRYAWDLALHAVESWAVLAIRADDPTALSGRAPRGSERPEHLVRCALDSEINYWRSQSRNNIAGISSDAGSDRYAAIDLAIAAAKAELAADPDSETALPELAEIMLEHAPSDAVVARIRR